MRKTCFEVGLLSSPSIYVHFSLLLSLCRYIDEYDLRRFMIKEEVDIVFPMIDVGETGQIDRKALTEWVVCPIFPFLPN